MHDGLAFSSDDPHPQRATSAGSRITDAASLHGLAGRAGSAARSRSEIRQRILAHLADGPQRLKEIVTHANSTQTVALHQLKLLRRDSLVVRVGRATYARADLAPASSPSSVAWSPHQVRARILARLVDGPCRARQLAGHLGLAPSTTTGYLLALQRRGLVIRLRQGLYGCPDRPRPAPPSGVGAHAPLIRDDILACLADGARRAEQVAAHIDRTTATATGHLTAMRRRGLVVRLGWGVYARADLVAAASLPAVIARDHPVRDRILAYLSIDEARSLNDIAHRAGRAPADTLGHLRALVRAGLAQEATPRCFRRSIPVLASIAVAGD